MKKNVFLFMIVAIVMIMTSCGIVNKNKGSKSSSSDSTGVTVKKETQIQSNDSAGKKTFENKTKTEQSTADSNGLKVEFYPGDSIKPTGPVTISIDTAGYVVINPGGRPLKSITDTRTKKTTTTKTEKQAGTDSTHVGNRSENTKADSTGVGVKKNHQEDTSHTLRMPSPWWLIIFPVGWLLWKFRKKIPFIKNLF